MQPILTVEFSAKAGENEIKEESIAIHNAEELFAFVAPGGGCESIPDEVQEIRVLFLPAPRKEQQNPLSDHAATLQLGGVVFNGPITEILSTASQLIEKASRNELSRAFLIMLGAAQR